MELLIAP